MDRPPLPAPSTGFADSAAGGRGPRRPSLLLGALGGLAAATAGTLLVIGVIIPVFLGLDAGTGALMLVVTFAYPGIALTGTLAGLGIAVVRRIAAAHTEGYDSAAGVPDVPRRVAVAGVLLGLAAAGALTSGAELRANGWATVPMAAHPVLGAVGWAAMRRAWMAPGEVLHRRRLSGLSGAILFAAAGWLGASFTVRSGAAALAIVLILAAIGLRAGHRWYDADPR